MVAQNAHRIQQLAQQYQKNIFVYFCFCGYYFTCIFVTATSIFKIISQHLTVHCHYVFSMKLVAYVTDRIYFLPDAFCCSHGGLGKKRAHESREGSGGKVFCDQYPFIKRSKSCRQNIFEIVDICICMIVILYIWKPALLVTYINVQYTYTETPHQIQE